MKYTDEQSDEAVQNDIFTRELVEQLKILIKNSDKQMSKLLKILYYGGDFLIISAMTWLIGTSLASFGEKGIVCSVSLYLIIFFAAGYILRFFMRHLSQKTSVS